MRIQFHHLSPRDSSNSSYSNESRKMRGKERKREERCGEHEDWRVEGFMKGAERDLETKQEMHYDG